MQVGPAIDQSGTPVPAVRAPVQITTWRIQKSLLAHWQIVAVIAVFLGTALWVPVMTPVATTDDWGYSRSVEILLEDHRLTVFPVVAATAVFQIVWGALFALFTENVLGAVRVSTLAMTAIGGLAMYDICRRLGVSPARAALGVAAYLFNPLTFVLSYSFMTDPHFTAVMLIATACTVRAVRNPEHASYRWLLAGSVAAAMAILIRQQGVLIPLAVVVALICFRQAEIRRILAVTLVPVITTGAYLAWLRWINGVPDVQTEFSAEIRQAGLRGTLELVSSVTYFELMYAGFFVLPVAAAAIASYPLLMRGINGWAWLIVVVWIIVAAAGLMYFADTRRRMPYVPQFAGSGGLGPPDVRGSRPRLFEQPFFDWLTALCLISTCLLAIIIARGVMQDSSQLRGGAGMVVAILAGQVAGVLPPSYHYLNRGYSLDRYLLPILPLSLILVLWGLGNLRIIAPIGWVIVLTLALFSMAATRDYLRYLDTAWNVADYAIEQGAHPDQIDAGAAWVGYHLYTDGVERGITRARTRDGPWWTFFYGKATDSSYVVSSRRQDGYVTVAAIPYPSLLQSDQTVLLLLRRTTAPWPPESADD